MRLIFIVLSLILSYGAFQSAASANEAQEVLVEGTLVAEGESDEEESDEEETEEESEGDEGYTYEG